MPKRHIARVAFIVTMMCWSTSNAAILVDDDGACTTEQADEIGRTIDRVTGIMSVADSLISPSSSVYEEWFGTYSVDRGNEVKDAIAHIAYLLTDSGVVHRIDCDPFRAECTNEQSACTSRESSVLRTYLTNDWFVMDSCAFEADGNRTGVLVHELSHADSGTYDVANNFWDCTTTIGGRFVMDDPPASLADACTDMANICIPIQEGETPANAVCGST